MNVPEQFHSFCVPVPKVLIAESKQESSMRRFIVKATIALGAAAMIVGVAPTVQASEMLPAGITRQLDHQTIEFTMTEAKRERLMFIQENMNRQRYYGRGDGYGNRGYGYGRRHGGPPPWAPAYGYRRNHYDRW